MFFVSVDFCGKMQDSIEKNIYVTLGTKNEKVE